MKKLGFNKTKDNQQNNKKVTVWLAVSFIIASAIIYTETSFFDAIVDRLNRAIRGETEESIVSIDKKFVAISNPYERIEQKFVDDGTTFIKADLSDRIINRYVAGKSDLEIPIKALPSETTWWQTPPGLYQIRTKKPLHQSTFGPVEMPWNLPFQGNFFIHGWPRYISSGNPAVSEVSGGCIRVSEDNASKLYSQVAVGEPVLVTTDEFNLAMYPSQSRYFTIPQTVKAQSVLVANLRTGEVYAAREPDTQLFAGDLNLMLAALTNVEYLGLEKSINLPRATTGEASERLDYGANYSVWDILFPTLEERKWIGPQAFAHYQGSGRYLDRIEDKAHSLIMSQTEVQTLDTTDATTQLTSAIDQYRLLKYLDQYRYFLLDITKGNINTYLYGEPATDRNWPRDILPGYEEFSGGMIDKVEGSTGSRNAAVILDLDINDSGNTSPIVFISLDSSDALQDVIDLRTSLLNSKAR